MADLRTVGGEKYAQIVRAGVPAERWRPTSWRRMPMARRCFFQGEFQQRLHRYGGRDLSESPFLLLFESEAAGRRVEAGDGVRHAAALAVSVSRRTIWARIRWPMGRSTAAARQTEENQMPVEESGNMLILLGALTSAEGNAEFAEANTGRC